MVLVAVVVLQVVVGVMFPNLRFQNESFIVAGVTGGEAVEPFGDLVTD